MRRTLPAFTLLVLSAALVLGAAEGRAQSVVDRSGERIPRDELAMILRNLNSESNEPSAIRIRNLRRIEGPPVILCGEISVGSALGVRTEFRTFSAVPEQQIVFSPYDVSGDHIGIFDSIIAAHCGGR
ncbi:hypothetical protein [Methylobacterium nodulans]|uniref:Uncharacterized protein n=1 Tax=Methylobacterium nodulans (strain LMG 21967 / CNCM I-2342 / ORS 2060) TaxID=460265 RepID=B8IG52_METNO|nr:hypothetical protein [Methylobacterium nodulans]ACL61529.1 conserved hypothetical protein [Methylobacterium nodulans ORS 2060]